LAAKGDLGFENPKICIQVKSGTAVGLFKRLVIFFLIVFYYAFKRQ
jgi:predicted Mrr-cat superfamily restriction endonuclease